jgi:hypothetical protein
MGRRILSRDGVCLLITERKGGNGWLAGWLAG